MLFYKHLIRPVLFWLDPEDAHLLALRALRVAGIPPMRHILARMTRVAGLEREVCGIRFPNPVGLAAGFDKNAVALHGLAALGFGFLEVGTITLKPQVGNPRPRIARLAKERSIINSMGFPSAGSERVAKNLKQCGAVGVPILINIGKNKETPNERAADEYAECLHTLYPYGDVFVCNVSSPNTKGLRDLQAKEPVRALCERLQKELTTLARERGEKKKPLLLKISPDLDEQGLNDLLDAVLEANVDGLIISNTTIARPDSLAQKYKDLPGGLSGHPILFQKMLALVRATHQRAPQLPIIAAGSITNAAQAQEALDRGASLVQIFSGMVYEGPFLAARMNKELKETPLGLTQTDAVQGAIRKIL